MATADRNRRPLDPTDAEILGSAEGREADARDTRSPDGGRFRNVPRDEAPARPDDVITDPVTGEAEGLDPTEEATRRAAEDVFDDEEALDDEQNGETEDEDRFPEGWPPDRRDTDDDDAG
ncbi:hypothetical protein [Tistrella mobilis]|uniref:Uncharacterized protein n=1 Tax=Tistrella mobilis (strain KA081020-065) TaxID=1110502 RepID=I3TSH2_TISMK|nr:hypothetical protein [Tistrella mobilis]AFK55710.1 hypothetical protein TMO_a0307 [Tistrella mobilis KA081020-065]